MHFMLLMEHPETFVETMPNFSQSRYVHLQLVIRIQGLYIVVPKHLMQMKISLRGC